MTTIENLCISFISGFLVWWCLWSQNETWIRKRADDTRVHCANIKRDWKTHFVKYFNGTLQANIDFSQFSEIHFISNRNFKPNHTVPCHTVPNLIEKEKYVIFNLQQKLSFMFHWKVCVVLSIFLENRKIFS